MRRFLSRLLRGPRPFCGAVLPIAWTAGNVTGREANSPRPLSSVRARVDSNGGMK